MPVGCWCTNLSCPLVQSQVDPHLPFEAHEGSRAHDPSYAQGTALAQPIAAQGPVPTIGGPHCGLLQTKPQLIKKIAAMPIIPGISRRARSPKKSKLGLGLPGY